jgi:hypothetical protein
MLNTLVNSALESLAWGAKKTWQLGRSGRIGRGILGAAAGGLYGAFNTDYESGQLQLESVTKGIMLGGLAAGLGPTAIRTVGRISRGRGLRAALSVGKWAGKKAFWAAAEHPLLVGGAIGGAMAINWSGSYHSTTLGQNLAPSVMGGQMQVRYDQQAAAANELTGGSGQVGTGQVGPGYAMMGNYQRAFQNSTQGLVQGLNRGRHG